MTEERNLSDVGARVEQLLTELGSADDPRVQEKTEEAVRLLMELYGGGLGRIVEILSAHGHDDMLERLVADDLVGSLLVLHDLHPRDTATRVREALDRVRPYLGSHAGGVELLGVTGGTVHLRLEGSCDGCPSSAVTVKLAIERAIEEIAPEVTSVEVEGMTESSNDKHGDPSVIPVESLFQRHDSGGDGEIGHLRWLAVPGVDGLGRGELRGVEVDGASVVVCNAGGTLYAYRDACPSCGTGVARGRLSGAVLTCPACGREYDVRLAGRSAETRDVHLEPLPLLTEGDEVRIAVAAGVSS